MKTGSFKRIGLLAFIILIAGTAVFLPLCRDGAQAAGPAASVRILTLDDVRTIAMDQNKDIQKALEYRRYVEGRYVTERAAALPQLDRSPGCHEIP